ncbi:MAG: single-stranded DNA-binding protein, partial [Thermosynechococcaceae cyanobacterium]
MNSCVLMAEIIKAPELRYTQDGQTAIAEMTVQFPAIRAEDPMETVKVVSWGNMAQQVQEQYKQGDQIVIEGRLTVNSIDRPEGFKEKVAELTASRIHPMSMGAVTTAVPSMPTA